MPTSSSRLAARGRDPFVENRLRFAVDLLDELLTGDVADDAVIAGRSWPPRDEVLRNGPAAELALPEAWPFAELEALRAEKEPLTAIPGEHDFFDLPSRKGPRGDRHGSCGDPRGVAVSRSASSRPSSCGDGEDALLGANVMLVRPSSVERELRFGEGALTELVISPEGSGVPRE